MYSFSYLEPVCCSMSSSKCCFLACIQISQQAGQVVWYSHLFQNFPVIVICTVKGFGIVNKAEIDVFLELSRFFGDPADVGNLISGSSAFSKTSLNIWKFTVLILLKPGLENFKHYFTCLWDECNCAVVWAFFGIAFLWDWNENWMWSTGEGNGKPLQYSCLENPMNSMKRQKDRTLKDELPRSVGTQYATGDQWRNNSKRMKGWSQSKNNTQLWMGLVMEAGFDAIKRNIA